MSDLQKRFEAWLEAEFGMWAIPVSGKYKSRQTQAMWEAWQAATQSQTAPAVPDVVGAALKIINQALALPAKPLPDPVAHSHEAYARALHEAFCAIRFKLMNARDALAAAPQPDHSPDAGKVMQGGKAYAHAVITQDGSIDYIVAVPCEAVDPEGAAKQMCRNHIEAAIFADTEGAETWVIRPLYTHPADSREEIQAQALETYADQLDAVFERAQEARAVNCPAWHSGQFAKDARKQAARLRASQQEGGESHE